MSKFWTTLILFSLLTGCGSGTVVAINLHHVAQSEIVYQCDEPLAQGCASRWETPEGRKACDVYIQPKEVWIGRTWSLADGRIISGIDIYMYILGHEIRHCFEGSFHD